MDPQDEIRKQRKLLYTGIGLLWPAWFFFRTKKFRITPMDKTNLNKELLFRIGLSQILCQTYRVYFDSEGFKDAASIQSAVGASQS